MSFDIDEITEIQSLSNLRYQLKRVCNKIKQEFSHQLDSINENTNEIQSNFEYLTEIDSKIEKLSSRVDKIQLYLFKKQELVADEEESYIVQNLLPNEQRIFVVLYTSNAPLSYSEIALKVNLSDSLVRSYVTNIIEKGVPLVKRYRSGKPIMALDDKFKAAQAKDNIVKIQQKSIQNF